MATLLTLTEVRNFSDNPDSGWAKDTYRSPSPLTAKNPLIPRSSRSLNFLVAFTVRVVLPYFSELNYA